MLIEQIPIAEIALLPVAAPGFLPSHRGADTTPGPLRPFTQRIIRDTARTGATKDHFLIDGAPNCSVPDHSMKR